MNFKKSNKKQRTKHIERYYMIRRIDVFGKINIPKVIRKYLKIHRLDKVKIEVEDGKIIITSDFKIWFFFTYFVNMITTGKEVKWKKY